MHDLVIDNAQVVDGLGAPAFAGGLAIKSGRIVAVGTDLGQAHTHVDADGLVLAPGIIDLHTHFDAQLTWDSFATPSPTNGVTTVVIGNCGFTIAPCKPEHRDLTMRNLEHVEGMPLEALRAGVDWSFESYPEYLDLLEQKGSVPNVASFCGHSSVRVNVMGEDAMKRTATDAEVAQMKRIVREAMAAGAIGFSTSTLEQHNGENGVPMPSRFAGEYELLELTGALGEAGKGVFMLTKGMNTTVPWLEDVAARNGRPVMIAAMFTDPNDPERVVREFGEIETARRRGRELWGQVGCYPLGMEFSAVATLSAACHDLLAPRHGGAGHRALSSVVRGSIVPRERQGRGAHPGCAGTLFLSLLRADAGAGHAKSEVQIAYRQRGRGPCARDGQGSLRLGVRSCTRRRNADDVRLQAVQYRRRPRA